MGRINEIEPDEMGKIDGRELDRMDEINEFKS